MIAQQVISCGGGLDHIALAYIAGAYWLTK